MRACSSGYTDALSICLHIPVTTYIVLRMLHSRIVHAAHASLHAHGHLNPRWVMPFGRMQNKNNPEGHEGPARRFVQFGGGISAEQLDWLVQQLADARDAHQRVIVCGHLPLHPGTCIGTCLLWNYEQVLQAIWDAGNVVATISGHAHNVSMCTPMHCLPCVRQATVMHCVQAAHANMLTLHVKWAHTLPHQTLLSTCYLLCQTFCSILRGCTCEVWQISAWRLFTAVLSQWNAVCECRMGMQLTSMGSTTGF
jgi:hypothetical protein